MSNPKQVLVVRTKFPDGRGGFMTPRKGKMIAQACHASLKVLLDMPGAGIWTAGNGKNVFSVDDIPTAMREWLTNRFTKIVLQVESEAELDELYAQARAAKIPCALVVDAGLTEFIGPEKTVVAIGPDLPERIDPITGGLKLL